MVSNVYGTQRLTGADLVDKAHKACRLQLGQVTAEMLESARVNLNLLFTELTNRGRMLWTVKQQVIPMTKGRYRYPLAVGVLDVRSAMRRWMPQAANPLLGFASGGFPGNAFDKDLQTLCSVGAVNGWVGYDFQGDVQLDTVGLYPASSGTSDLILEKSDTGVFWTTHATWTNVTLEPNTWWAETLTDIGTARFWRIRAPTWAISIAECLMAHGSTDIPMSLMNQDDYSNLPNKSFLGDPLQYWLDMARDEPVLVLWPVPRTMMQFAIVAWVKYQVMDVVTLLDGLDLPQRWEPAIVAMLAQKIFGELPQELVSDPTLEARLEANASKQFAIAFGEETDGSLSRLMPNIRPYTR